MSNRTAARVRVRIDFASGRSLGPGKIELLEAIAQGGSLSAAARSLALSYRRAWLLLDDMNSSFSELVVQTTAGGSHGGGASLTPFGEKLIKAYRRLEDRTNREVSKLDAVLATPSAARRGAGLPRQRLARTILSR